MKQGDYKNMDHFAFCPKCQYLLRPRGITVNPKADLFDQMRIMGYECLNGDCDWGKCRIED